jgi:hypothetical protein
LLDQPNPADPAQTDGYHLFIQVRRKNNDHSAIYFLVSLKINEFFSTKKYRILQNISDVFVCRPSNILLWSEDVGIPEIHDPSCKSAW